MKFSAVIATLFTISASSLAATVSIEETPCIQNNTQIKGYTIETDKLVVQEMKSVCGLRIKSASGVDVRAITCLAFKDKEGKNVGSAHFSFDAPALISTNPVQEGSIRCDTNGPSKPSTITTAASSGTGIPTPSSGANSTINVPTQPSPTLAPSGSATEAPNGPNAAGQLSLSLGAVVAAFAVFIL